MKMLDRITPDTAITERALEGEHLDLVVRRTARRRVLITGDVVSVADESTEVSIMVRSIAGGVAGCATANRADRATLQWAVQQARELRTAGRSAMRWPTPSSVGPPQVSDRRPQLRALVDLPLPRSVAVLRELTSAALTHAGVTSANAVWDHVGSVVTVAGSGRVPVTYTQPEVTIALTVRASDGRHQASGTAGRTAVALDRIDPATLVAEAHREAIRQLPRSDLRQPAIPSTSPLVIAPRPWSRLLAQIAATFYTDRRDLTRSGLRAPSARLLRGGFHLVDDPTAAADLAHPPCDDEGTRTRRTVIIDDGELATLLSDLSSAEPGRPSTGNGWMVPTGSGVGHGIAVAGSCLAVEGASRPLEELLGSAPLLLYVSRIDDGHDRGVDAPNDSIRLTLSGWLVRDGEPAGPIRSATIGIPLSSFLAAVGGLSNAAHHYRVAAGSTHRKGPAVRSSHVLVHDIPLMPGEQR